MSFDDTHFIVDFSFTPQTTPTGAPGVVPVIATTPTDPGIQPTQNPQIVQPSFRDVLLFAVFKGNTGGTLDIYLQNSVDKGNSWTDRVHFPQLAAAAATVAYTFSISRTKTSGGIIVTGGQVPGFDLSGGSGVNTPLLAANTFVDGNWGDRWRLVYVNGAGTSASFAQFLKMMFTK